MTGAKSLDYPTKSSKIGAFCPFAEAFWSFARVKRPDYPIRISDIGADCLFLGVKSLDYPTKSSEIDVASRFAGPFERFKGVRDNVVLIHRGAEIHPAPLPIQPYFIGDQALHCRRGNRVAPKNSSPLGQDFVRPFKQRTQPANERSFPVFYQRKGLLVSACPDTLAGESENYRGWALNSK